MDLTRAVALQLALDGRIFIERKSERLDPQNWDASGRRGLVRLRLATRVLSDQTSGTGRR